MAEAGLITKVPGMKGGSFVEYVDHHALSMLVSQRMSSVLDLGSITHEEVANFRDLLEVPCARLAARNRTSDDLTALHDVIEQEKVAEFQDPAIPELNAQFHSAMAAATQNRVLAAFVTALHRVAHPITFIHTDAEVGKQAVRHHIELFAAIKKQDEDAAVEVMRRHLVFLDEHAERISA